MASKLLFLESMDIFATIPQYHALIFAFIGLWLVWILAKRIYVRNGASQEPGNAQVERKLSDWYPEPMVAEISKDHPSLRPRRINSRVGKRLLVDGVDCLDLGTHDYLGFAESKKIDEKAIAAVKKYGVGSCGPRGFYGTVDVHLELEERLAKFMRTEEAIVYSYGFSAVASAIPAYCKRRDIVFADERVNFAIQQGLEASRSLVRYFKHNDTDHLEQLLEERNIADRKNPKRAAALRRFLVVEGIYLDTGLVCPLPRLLRLCEKYKMRIFVDESVSIGTLGAAGKGVTEHFGVDRSRVDMIMGSMERSLGSIGGFCVGSSFVIEHQRLSGLGYCFSASLPPLLTSAAITALDLIEDDPSIFSALKRNCLAFDSGLRKLDFFEVSSIPESPIKHVYLRGEPRRDRQDALLEKISQECIKNGLAVIKAAYLEAERRVPRPSLRICVSVILNEDDIDFALETLQKCTKFILLAR